VPQDSVPAPSINSMTELTKESLELVARRALPAVAIGFDPGGADTGETDLNEQRAPANVVIYSAGWVTVAVSAPGLTSMIRRENGRLRRRSTVVPRRRFSGSPR
jgi:hypothetical protein